MWDSLLFFSIDVGVAVETFTEVDARAEMFGECCQLRDLIAVLESWLEALELRNSRSIQITAEKSVSKQ